MTSHQLPLGIRLTIVLAAIAALVYLIAIPVYEVFIASPDTEMMTELQDLSLGERIRQQVMAFVVGGWFAAFGASWGSFLNVVVYRLPLKRSLISQPSACPKCGSRIRLRDNLPVLGWLLLGGRCRDCQAPISFRYPLVEAIAGAVFFAIYYFETLSGGATIPLRTVDLYTGVVWIVLYTKWDLIGLLMFHGYGLAYLLTWSLIRWDGHHVPARSAILASLTLLTLVGIWPHLMPVPFVWPVPNSLQELDRVTALLSAVIGAVGGGVLGQVVGTIGWRGSSGDAEQTPRETQALSLGLMVAGLMFGWQAVLGIAMLTLPLQALLMSVAVWSGPMRVARTVGLSLFAASAIHLLLWRWLTESCAVIWPGPRCSVTSLIVAGVTIVGGAVLCRVAIRWAEPLSLSVAEPIHE